MIKINGLKTTFVLNENGINHTGLGMSDTIRFISCNQDLGSRKPQFRFWPQQQGQPIKLLNQELMTKGQYKGYLIELFGVINNPKDLMFGGRVKLFITANALNYFFKVDGLPNRIGF